MDFYKNANHRTRLPVRSGNRKRNGRLPGLLPLGRVTAELRSLTTEIIQATSLPCDLKRDELLTALKGLAAALPAWMELGMAVRMVRPGADAKRAHRRKLLRWHYEDVSKVEGCEALNDHGILPPELAPRLEGIASNLRQVPLSPEFERSEFIKALRDLGLALPPCLGLRLTVWSALRATRYSPC